MTQDLKPYRKWCPKPGVGNPVHMDFKNKGKKLHQNRILLVGRPQIGKTNIFLIGNFWFSLFTCGTQVLKHCLVPPPQPLKPSCKMHLLLKYSREWFCQSFQLFFLQNIYKDCKWYLIHYFMTAMRLVCTCFNLDQSKFFRKSESGVMF